MKQNRLISHVSEDLNLVFLHYEFLCINIQLKCFFATPYTGASS